MKVFALAVCFAILAYVAAESCKSVGDCSHVTCDSGHALTCHFTQCTCSSGAGCSSQSDCSGNCRHGDWHCVDGGCRCGWGLGGIGK